MEIKRLKTDTEVMYDYLKVLKKTYFSWIVLQIYSGPKVLGLIFLKTEELN
jgi:hypothetical protein